MGKDKTIFVCSSCGYESAKWLGKCHACNEWNSFYEEKIIKEKKNSAEKDRSFFLYKTGRFNAKYLSRDHTGSVDFGYRDAGSVWIGISKAATEK